MMIDLLALLYVSNFGGISAGDYTKERFGNISIGIRSFQSKLATNKWKAGLGVYEIMQTSIL